MKKYIIFFALFLLFHNVLYGQRIQFRNLKVSTDSVLLFGKTTNLNRNPAQQRAESINHQTYSDPIFIKIETSDYAEPIKIRVTVRNAKNNDILLKKTTSIEKENNRFFYRKDKRKVFVNNSIILKENIRGIYNIPVVMVFVDILDSKDRVMDANYYEMKIQPNLN